MSTAAAADLDEGDIPSLYSGPRGNLELCVAAPDPPIGTTHTDGLFDSFAWPRSNSLSKVVDDKKVPPACSWSGRKATDPIKTVPRVFNPKPRQGVLCDRVQLASVLRSDG